MATGCTSEELAEPRMRFRHRLCVVEARLVPAVRESLCGRILAGPRCPPVGLPWCPLCVDLFPGHLLLCPECMEHRAQRGRA